MKERIRLYQKIIYYEIAFVDFDDISGLLPRVDWRATMAIAS